MNMIYYVMDDFKRIHHRFIGRRIAWTSDNVAAVSDRGGNIYGGEKLAARLKVRERGRKRRLSTVLRILCMRPPFHGGGNATSYFSRRERMEIEAEMNATVTVVLGSPQSFAFLISATVFFFVSQPYIRIPFFFSFIYSTPRE